MPIPSQPMNLFTRPFASSGNFSTIPDISGISGRASLQAGFPPETQLPLNQGGIAPNRLDFNGILNMISAFSFWQQSGGQFSYSEALNYTQPNIVFFNGILWWCIKENGPDSVNGLQEPGSSPDYWVDLLTALSSMSSGPTTFGNPVGTIIMFSGTTAPEGYFSCNGGIYDVVDNPNLFAVLGSNRVPDMRGLFVRGYDPTGINDPSGATRSLLSQQGDAMRNFTGTFVANAEYHGAATGVFTCANYGSAEGWTGDVTSRDLFTLDPSRQVPTANENRPKNINLLYIIKHD